MGNELENKTGNCRICIGDSGTGTNPATMDLALYCSIKDTYVALDGTDARGCDKYDRGETKE